MTVMTQMTVDTGSSNSRARLGVGQDTPDGPQAGQPPNFFNQLWKWPEMIQFDR
jgi:hypothetical protein